VKGLVRRQLWQQQQQQGKGWSLPYHVRQTPCGRVAGAPCAPSAEKMKDKEEGVLIDFGHRVTASYLYSQPLSMTPW
jgi:hypothetical protein